MLGSEGADDVLGGSGGDLLMGAAGNDLPATSMRGKYWAAIAAIAANDDVLSAICGLYGYTTLHLAA